MTGVNGGENMSQANEPPKPPTAGAGNTEPDTLGELNALANQGDAM